MNLTPGDIISYRVGNRVTVRLAEVTEISPGSWTFTGQRVKSDGVVDRRDQSITDLFSSSFVTQTIEKVVTGTVVLYDMETDTYVEYNANEEAYYVYLGDGCIGAYDDLAGVIATLEELAL